MFDRARTKTGSAGSGPGKRARTRLMQLEWLEWLAERSGHTFTEIARRANKNPGTLTELRNEDKDRVLSDATIDDIAREYGVPGPLEFRAIPGFTEDAVPYRGAQVATNDTTDAWEMRANVLEALGIFAGDELHVDLSRLPRDGDVVIAQIFTGAMSARTVFRLYREIGRFAFLTTAYHDPRQNLIEIAGMSDVAIKGVMVSATKHVR